MTFPSASSAGLSRRDFVKSAAAAASAAALLAPTVTSTAYAQGSTKLRFGLIGCGQRGNGAIRDALSAAAQIKADVELTAVADVFKGNAQGLVGGLAGDPKLKSMVKATPETTFVGFDAYQKVIAGPVDVVLICAPPGFRPQHFAAAVEAGKHVFMEKPVGVDPVGIRKVLAAAKLAEEKKLSVVAGTQRRHDPAYRDIVGRIHDGAIGEITSAAAYWVGDYGYYPLRAKQPNWTDMEWHLRNWNYFCWLSGDHIVEQHVHNLDIMNWVFKGPPVKAFGIGGRQQRTSPDAGHIFDHFAVEYEWPGGVRVSSYCRQQNTLSKDKPLMNRVSEWVVGAKGKSNCAREIWGEKAYKSDKSANPYVVEHAHLLEAIRSGNPINDGKAVAESTLTAVLGRLVCYTGREINYSWLLNQSKLDLFPKSIEFGPVEVPPVPVPGMVELL